MSIAILIISITRLKIVVCFLTMVTPPRYCLQWQWMPRSSLFHVLHSFRSGRPPDSIPPCPPLSPAQQSIVAVVPSFRSIGISPLETTLPYKSPPSPRQKSFSFVPSGSPICPWSHYLLLQKSPASNQTITPIITADTAPRRPWWRMLQFHAHTLSHITMPFPITTLSLFLTSHMGGHSCNVEITLM